MLDFKTLHPFFPPSVFRCLVFFFVSEILYFVFTVWLNRNRLVYAALCFFSTACICMNVLQPDASSFD